MKFRDIRKRCGLTTKFVSKKLGVKITTLYKYEQHQVLPSASILLKMNEVYKCDYSELLEAYKFAKEVYCERKAKKWNQTINRRWNKKNMY